MAIPLVGFCFCKRGDWQAYVKPLQQNEPPLMPGAPFCHSERLQIERFNRKAGRESKAGRPGDFPVITIGHHRCAEPIGPEMVSAMRLPVFLSLPAFVLKHKVAAW
jgi:hypothetical protein